MTGAVRWQEEIRITATGLATCLGRGRAAHAAALWETRSGLARCTWPGLPFPCYTGEVAGLDRVPFPQHLAAWDNRATRIALAALEDGTGAAVARARARWGPARLGLVLGTSTSGVETAERAYRSRAPGARLPAAYSLRHHNDHHAVASFLAAHLGIEGPAYTVSTACSSSAKALVDAVQMIRAGLVDAALAGGVDSLCLTSLNGFEALQLVSRGPCRPCDAARDGLSIGEGGGFLLVERGDGPGPRLLGFGESSDATSMSTPPEDGAGAAAAMRAALASAGLGPEAIGCVKLHGTATPVNDVSECRAVAEVLGPEVPVASFKGMIGHTLGAAGAVEAALALIALEEEVIPGTAGLETPDPEIPAALSRTARPGAAAHLMANAFGFGGNNCALVLAA